MTTRKNYVILYKSLGGIYDIWKKKKSKSQKKAEEEASTEEEEETAKLKINLGELLGGAKDKDPRIIGLFGSVEEEKAGELCYHLITMSEPNTSIIEGEEPEPLEDITFYVSRLMVDPLMICFQFMM